MKRSSRSKARAKARRRALKPRGRKPGKVSLRDHGLRREVFMFYLGQLLAPLDLPNRESFAAIFGTLGSDMNAVSPLTLGDYAREVLEDDAASLAVRAIARKVLDDDLLASTLLGTSHRYRGGLGKRTERFIHGRRTYEHDAGDRSDARFNRADYLSREAPKLIERAGDEGRRLQHLAALVALLIREIGTGNPNARSVRLLFDMLTAADPEWRQLLPRAISEKLSPPTV
jgi:hypothetical protein